jgi:hypothetical protein
MTQGVFTLLLGKTQPLSGRLKISREQLSAMFEAGELSLLPDDTRWLLRGLQLFLLEAEEEAFVLENAHRIRQKVTKP